MTPSSYVGLQVIAERVVFSGDAPADEEREAKRQIIERRFTAALESDSLPSDDPAIRSAIERLFGRRDLWIEHPRFRMACVEADIDRDFLLPLECLKPPIGMAPVVIRCGWAGTESVDEMPCPRPEGGRIVIASSDAGGSLPEGAIVEALRIACQAGAHGFVTERDHVRSASKRRLDAALAAKPDVAILQLVCHVRERGLVLHDDAGHDEIVDADALASALAPFADRLRLIVLMPIDEQKESGRDPGRAIVEVALALHRKGFASVVAPRVPLPAAELGELASTLVRALLGDAHTSPASLEQAVAQVNHQLRLSKGLAWMGLRIYGGAADGNDTRPLVIRPYRGLLSFEREHARFYIGREKEAKQIIERIAEFEQAGEPRFVMLVGASGVGKSSLAKAGVVPAMLGADPTRVPVITRPSEDLDAALASSEGTRRLIVIDQLEEVITGDSKDASAYLQRLWILAAADDCSAVVATLRIDALNLGGELVVVPASATEPARALEAVYDSAHTIFIKQLETDQLAAVIEQPAKHVGLTFDPGLVDRLCTEALAEPGALPMLELVLDRLWTQRRGRVLLADAYQGGLARTLAVHANECLGSLTPAERHQGKRILIGIATGKDIELATWRRRSTITKLRPSHPERRDAFGSALDALIDGRLVVSGGDATIELAHELLLRQWRELGEWIHASQARIQVIQDLDAWVEEWRQRSTLLTADQLGYVAQVELDEDDLSADVTQLLVASRRFLRRSKRLRRVGFLGVVVVAVMLAGLSYVAVSRGNAVAEERDNALEQTRLAEQQTALAESRLDQAVKLARTIIGEALPKLDPYPQVRHVRKEILERLQDMLRELGVTEIDTEAQRETMAAHKLRGDEALHTDNLDVARREYSTGLAIAESLAVTDPSSAQAQRDLSKSLDILGKIEFDAGNLDAARKFVHRSLAITEALAIADPSNALIERDLFVSLAYLGHIEVNAGNLDTARKLFVRSLAIADALANADLSSAVAQRDVTFPLGYLGDLEVNVGNLDAARKIFLRSLAITEALATADPSSIRAQRDLSESLDHLGNIEFRAGNLDAARKLFLRSLAITETLATADPSSAQARRELSISLDRLGDIEVDTGNLYTARKLFLRSLAIREALATTDPSSARTQRDLSVSLECLSDIEFSAGNLDAARELLRRSLSIAEALASSDPSSARAQRDLCVSLYKLGNIEVSAGNLDLARELLRRSLAITETLATAATASAQTQRDLSEILHKLGEIEATAGNLDLARKLFLRSLAITEALHH